jgi:hypothetical protein
VKLRTKAQRAQASAQVCCSEHKVGKGNGRSIWSQCGHVVIVIVIVITNQDSTSSRLLPGSSYSCCIRNLHALVAGCNVETGS